MHIQMLRELADNWLYYFGLALIGHQAWEYPLTAAVVLAMVLGNHFGRWARHRYIMWSNRRLGILELEDHPRPAHASRQH